MPKSDMHLSRSLNHPQHLPAFLLGPIVRGHAPTYAAALHLSRLVSGVVVRRADSIVSMFGVWPRDEILIIVATNRKLKDLLGNILRKQSSNTPFIP
jgi:hypothetical protein